MWELESGRSVEHAMTMTFASLVLIQFFKAYNFRSDRVSVLHEPFKNRWLNLSIVCEFLLLVAIVYVPALQKPFATYGLSLVDWGIVLVAAVTICPVLETAKWLERRGWFGELD
jgi:Ca2+-transporting ATPase